MTDKELNLHIKRSAEIILEAKGNIVCPAIHISTNTLPCTDVCGTIFPNWARHNDCFGSICPCLTLETDGVIKTFWKYVYSALKTVK